MTEDYITAILWPGIGILQLSHIIFTGRENSSVNWHKTPAQHPHTAAVSHYGLCFSLDTLIKTTSDPEEVCRITVTPGRIEWNGMPFDSIRDPGRRSEAEGITQDPYRSTSSLTDITAYDDLADSSSPNLRAELIVVETPTETRSLRVAYRISTPKHPGHHFSIGPAKIWSQLNKAYTASRCHGKVCKSLNGFRSYPLQGEGPLINPPELVKTIPIVRVLSSSDLAIWAAVSVEVVDRFQPHYRLQMRQCIRCCDWLGESSKRLFRRGLVNDGTYGVFNCVSIDWN